MKSPKKFYVLTAALTLIVVIALTGTAELQLRRNGTVANHCEQIGISCPMFFELPLPEPWLFVRARNSRFSYVTSEFRKELVGNSEGLPGKEIPVLKRPNEFRVIVLGDSFTEGIGASAGHEYVDLLRQHFAELGTARPFTVMNAGMAGSDPIFYLELLKHKLAAYKPDLVVMAMNASDITDIKRRGGFDRFDSDGSLKPLPRPRMAWLFEHSHLVRAFFLKVLHYDWDLRTPEEERARTEMAVQTLVESGKSLHEFSNKMGFRSYVMFHPYSYEIKAKRIVKELETVEQGLHEHHVSVLNLLDGFSRQIPVEELDNYFWPIDGHCNDKGYRVFADVLWNELKSANALTSIRNI